MRIEIPDGDAPAIWAALRGRIRELHRNGLEPEPGVEKFADKLLETADRRVTRTRELARARNARYRARLRAQRQSLSA